MEQTPTRIALIGIVVENSDSVEQLNSLLFAYLLLSFRQFHGVFYPQPVIQSHEITPFPSRNTKNGYQWKKNGFFAT